MSDSIISSRCCGSATSLPEAAVCWFDFGLNVIPVVPKTKKPVALWDPWLKDLDRQKIESHWHRYPHHEIGFIVGDDHILFDADTPEALAALEALEAQHGISSRLVVKTSRGVHHHFRKAPGTFAKSDSHSTEDYPERIDVKTGKALGILPPSTNKTVITCDAKASSDLSEINQAFIDAVAKHNGRQPPRPAPEIPKAKRKVIAPSGDTGKLEALLEHLDPDSGYEDWVHVLMAIHHESGGSDEGFALADEWSSKGDKYKGTADIQAKWSSFANYDGTPITIATLRKMVKDQGLDVQKVQSQAEPFPTFETEVVQPDALSAENAPEATTPENPLLAYSLRGHGHRLEQKATAEVYVIDQLALMGQWTNIFGPPNSAKTLLTWYGTIESINAGRIDPNKVFYVNVDDNLAGIITKNRIAEEYHFHMLADGHLGFRSNVLRSMLWDITINDQADGTILILDTAKKFTNLMDKSKASGFGQLIRPFVMKGGTVIALAHVNKHPGRDGKPTYAGTTDFVDDADCAYTIDVLEANQAGQRIVVFDNIKRRGNNALSAYFRYSVEDGLSYEERLASVSPVDEAQVLTLQQAVEQQTDADIIDAVTACIGEGVVSKMKLAQAAAARSGCSKRSAIRVIEKYAGDNPEKHRWRYTVRDHGAKVFEVLSHDD